MSEKLAIHGSKPVRTKMLPYGLHWIDEEDIQAVVDVLRSNWITMGPKIDEFEQSVCHYTGAQYAVAVSSGTAALHGAMFGLGIEPGDEVITTPMTFAATSNAILYLGGTPVFADIDPNNGDIDPIEIEKKVTPKTKAIIPVHYAGLPCDMVAIREIADQFNLNVVEDAAHALGAEYKIDSKWYKVGACAHSNMATFSFHPVKHITTGEGGMITFRDIELGRKTKMVRMHGISLGFRERVKLSFHWLYDMERLGFNYRISDFQCALGISQLRKIDEFINKRDKIAERYNKAFKNMSELDLTLTASYSREEKKHAWHIYVVKINSDLLKAGRKEIYLALNAENIGAGVHYIPVHYHPYYKEKFGFKKGDFPKAEEFYEQVITLPMFPRMNEKDIKDVIQGVRKVLNYYRK